MYCVTVSRTCFLVLSSLRLPVVANLAAVLARQGALASQSALPPVVPDIRVSCPKGYKTIQCGSKMSVHLE